MIKVKLEFKGTKRKKSNLAIDKQVIASNIIELAEEIFECGIDLKEYGLLEKDNVVEMLFNFNVLVDSENLTNYATKLIDDFTHVWVKDKYIDFAEYDITITTHIENDRYQKIIRG